MSIEQQESESIVGERLRIGEERLSLRQGVPDVEDGEPAVDKSSSYDSRR